LWLGWLDLVRVVVHGVKESSQDIVVNIALSVVSQTIDMSPLPKRGERGPLLSKLLKVRSILVFFISYNGT